MLLVLLVLLVHPAYLLQVQLLKAHTTIATTSSIYGVKLQKFKPPMDTETFVNRFEQYCLTQKIEISDKANFIIHALDDSTFSVIKRELIDVERTNYDTVKARLLKRFELHKEIGQKRMLFRQVKHEGAQTLEEFYSHLLRLATKVFQEETADTVDRMITDQFIYILRGGAYVYHSAISHMD